MIVQLAGLSFHTVSPSRFELLSVRDDIGRGDTVEIRYSGSMSWPSGYIGPGKWAIVYTQANGHGISRYFNSRDAAVDLIASRQS